MELSRYEIVEYIRRKYIPVAARHTQLTKLTSSKEIDTLPRGQTAFYVLSPNGDRILAQPLGIGGEQLLSFLKQGMRGYESLPPRNVGSGASLNPRWGAGVDNGMAHVGLFFRLGEASKEYRVWDLELTVLRSIAPTSPTVGETYAVPIESGRRLVPILGYIPPWIPEQKPEVRLSANVIAVSGETVDVMIEGTLSGRHNMVDPPASGRLKGIITYSRSGQPLSLLLVNRGTYSVSWGPYKIEGLMEWRAEGQTGRRVSGGS